MKECGGNDRCGLPDRRVWPAHGRGDPETERRAGSDELETKLPREGGGPCSMWLQRKRKRKPRPMRECSCPQARQSNGHKKQSHSCPDGTVGRAAPRSGPSSERHTRGTAASSRPSSAKIQTLPSAKWIISKSMFKSSISICTPHVHLVFFREAQIRRRKQVPGFRCERVGLSPYACPMTLYVIGVVGLSVDAADLANHAKTNSSSCTPH
jgi:hypothetical protein